MLLRIFSYLFFWGGGEELNNINNKLHVILTCKYRLQSPFNLFSFFLTNKLWASSSFNLSFVMKNVPVVFIDTETVFLDYSTKFIS